MRTSPTSQRVQTGRWTTVTETSMKLKSFSKCTGCPALLPVACFFLCVVIWCRLEGMSASTELQQHRNAFSRRHGGTEIITQRARSQCAALNLPCIVNRQFLQDKSTGSIVLLTYYSGLATRITAKTGYVIREENNPNFVLRPRVLHPLSFSQQARWFHWHRARVSAICPPYWWGSLKKVWIKQGLSLPTHQRSLNWHPAGSLYINNYSGVCAGWKQQEIFFLRNKQSWGCIKRWKRAY